MNPIINPAAAIVTWLSGIMLSVAPPDRSVVIREANLVESEKARYEEFAEDVAKVAYDPEEAPLFSGKNARANTAAVLMSVAFYESGFRRDVDLGVGPQSRGDGGRSCTSFQFNIGTTGKTREGWTCKEMYADRTLAVRAALAMIRMSMSSCRSLPSEDRLSMYTSGHCQENQVQSRLRVTTARKWLQRWAPPMSDDDAAAQAASDQATNGIPVDLTQVAVD